MMDQGKREMSRQKQMGLKHGSHRYTDVQPLRIAASRNQQNDTLCLLTECEGQMDSKNRRTFVHKITLKQPKPGSHQQEVCVRK